MRKNFKTLICAAAILGSMSASNVQALEIDTDVNQSTSITYDESVTVKDNGIWNITDDSSPTIIEINDKLTNNGFIKNNASLVVKEIDNTLLIEKNLQLNSNSSLTITNGGANRYKISQGILKLTGGTLENFGEIITDSSLEIGSDAVLNNNDDSLVRVISGSLTNNGTLNNAGTLNIEDTLNNLGKIAGANGILSVKDGSNSSSIIQNELRITGNFSNTGEMTANSEFSNSGTLTGDTGKLTVNGGANTGTISQREFVNSSGEFNNSNIIEAEDFSNAGIFNNKSGASLVVGDLSNSGNFVNSGDVIADEINNIGIFNNSGNLGASNDKIGTINNDGTFNNSGTAYINNFVNGANNSNSTLTNSGTFNSDLITNNGSIINNSSESAVGSIIAGSITNSGSITNAGEISISNSLENNGTISNAGTITVADTGSLTNTSNINNNGTISSNSFTNGVDAEITGSGNLNLKQGQNDGKISQTKITIVEGSSFLNNNYIETDILNNKSNLIGIGGTLLIKGDGSGNGGSNALGASISQDKLAIEANFVNDGSIKSNDFTNKKNLTGSGNLTIINGSNTGSIAQKDLSVVENFENNGKIEISNSLSVGEDGVISGANGSLIVDNGLNKGKINQKDITVKGELGNFINAGEVVSTDKFENSGKFIGDDTYGNGSLTVANGLNHNNGLISQSKLTITQNTTGFKNNGSIIAEIINNGTFNNTGNIGDDTAGAVNNDFTNKGSFINSGNAYIKDLSNFGTINNTSNIIVSGNLENTNLVENSGKLDVTGKLTNTKTIRNLAQGNITVSDEFINSDNFSNAGMVNANKVTNKGTIVNSGTFEATNITNGDANLTSSAIVNTGNLTVSDMINNAILKNKGNNSQLDITTSLTNNGSILNEGAMNFAANSVLVNTDIISVENGGSIVGAIVKNTKVISAKDASKLDFVSLDNAQGTISLKNGSRLNITNQTSAIEGTIIAEGNNNSSQNRIDVAGSNKDFIGTLLVGNNAGDKTDLTLGGINVTNDAQVGIAQAGKLILSGNSILNLNEGDTVKGDIELLTGGKLNLDGYNLITGDKSTQEGGNKAYYSQTGGTLNLINNSTLALGDSAAMIGGDLNIDGTSQFLVTSEENGTIYSANFLDNLTMADGARFGVMNSDGADYNIENINVNNGTANFTIDVLGRSNAEYEHGSDQFFGENINGNGTINIEDWTLAGDIFGWQAPIDRDIKLDNVFAYNNISPNVKLTATKKEVFTPIGWYQLNNHGGMNGNYQLNLTRFNPQVYRGQVTTLSQYMNQLAIDDMLFNHSMLLPSFKDDDLSDNGTMANRYAAANPLYAPYQYSKKDGGLWYRMYGTFETLQMNQAGLGRVGNNAYGTIIGADFGLKELKHGWKFMPTAYIGYNGAHQYFAGAGAYQNGGQAGFLGTWYKDNFVLGGLVYGGVYQNSMDIAGHTDNTFNYFAGASAKGAYNWRFHRDWVLQPNLMLAYNFFGQQNWHSDFGQMGMMSGILNGINLAPGMNLIWEKETFSIYATLQYMYNLNGAVDGRAGNVSLPHLYMDRGYIQYGFGFTKRFTDRFSGYFQTVFRNVGRTGVGFQLGLNIKLGK